MNRCAKFSLEPVGQGLFYTGRIGGFNMVYDCGELSGPKKILNLISDYKKDLGKSSIDMLVVSHLHYDHVCGLDELLRNAHVRYVFLPYLLPIQRLILAISKPVNANQSYYNFLMDPVSYFLEKGVETVILLGGKKGDKGPGKFDTTDNNSRNEGFDIDSEDFNNESILLPDDNDLREIILENDPQLIDPWFNTSILIKTHSGLVSLKNKWVFGFFVPPTDKNLKRFEGCIMRKFSQTKKINSAALRRILSNKSTLKELKKCYEKTFKRLNDTSLILFHGPTRRIYSFICPSSSSVMAPTPSRFYRCESPLEDNVTFGWVLTGDVDFNKVLPEFLNHFSAYLGHMTHLLIPHHGSKANWNPTVMKRVIKPSHWFVSFGLGNPYRHPNYDVIHDILSEGNTVSACNESLRIDQYVFT